MIYLFARLKLGWTEQDYTTWTAIGSVGTSFATFIVVTLLSYNWKIHDTLIGALGAFFGVFARITLAFANYSWEMYLGNYLLYRILNLLPNRSIKKSFFPPVATLIGLISTTPAMTVRSYLSKITPENELGAIFSLLASLEAAIPLVISPFMTYVYDHTIDVFPGAIMILQAGIYILSIISLFSVYLMSRKSFMNEESVGIITNEEINGDGDSFCEDELRN